MKSLASSKNMLLLTAASAALLLALASGQAQATGAVRTVAAPADAKECTQLVKDTKEMQAETEVTAEIDGQIDALMKTATEHCATTKFDAALVSVMEARKLLGS